MGFCDVPTNRRMARRIASQLAGLSLGPIRHLLADLSKHVESVAPEALSQVGRRLCPGETGGLA
jgi:hypothetical protein